MAQAPTKARLRRLFALGAPGYPCIVPGMAICFFLKMASIFVSNIHMASTCYSNIDGENDKTLLILEVPISRQTCTGQCHLSKAEPIQGLMFVDEKQGGFD